MENYCCTKYVFTGNKEDISKLYSIFKKHEDEDYRNNWYSDILIELGKSPKEMNCRGNFYNVELGDDKKTFRIDTYSVLEPCWEFIEFIAKEFSLKYYYKAVKKDYELYLTNDKRKKYFSYSSFFKIVDEYNLKIFLIHDIKSNISNNNLHKSTNKLKKLLKEIRDIEAKEQPNTSILSSFYTIDDIPNTHITVSGPLMYIDVKLMQLGCYMGKYLNLLMKKHNIDTIDQWNTLVLDNRFNKEAISFILKDYRSICKCMNLDPVKYSSALFDCVEDLMGMELDFNRLITDATGFEYRNYDILYTVTLAIKNNINKVK